MRLRVFHGRNASLALTAVREALGEDAVVLSTRRVGGGVEVTAALDLAEPELIEPEPEPPPPELARHNLSPGLGNAFPGPDLAAALGARLAFAPLPQDRPIMLVGPPGAGKTLTCAKLAARAKMAGQALAEAGGRVGLVDGDLGLANVDVQLGLDPRHDLGDVLAGRCSAEAAMLRHSAGFSVLPGRSGSAALARLGGAALGGLTATLRELPLDWLVLDLGAGIGTAQRDMAAMADLLIVVATEEPTSLTDAYAVLKLHRRDAPGARAGLVVNMAAQPGRVHAALDAACRGFLGHGLPLLGAVRRDPRVPAAIRAQAPLLTRFPNTQAAEDLRRLAAVLLGQE